MNVEVTICFECIPTIRQAFKQKMFATADLISMVIWFPALWTAGRLGHVYFAYLGDPHVVCNLETSKQRSRFNEQQELGVTYKIWVSRENLIKAMVVVDEANANRWRHPWCNCTTSISMLLYGHRNHYAWIGNFGWATRRVIKDVQKLQAAQR